jgi:hypothetical protein
MTGPANNTAASYLGDDGRWHHTFRQSWLGDALTVCLERARRDRAGILPRTESDAAALGTAVHAGIEVMLRDDRLDLVDANVTALAEWERISSLPNFAWKSFDEGDHGQVQQLIATALAAWEKDLRARLMPELIEHRFNIPLLEDDNRVIELQGTIDYIGALDGDPVVADWKTGKRKYGADKEKSIQASVYTLAVEQLGLGVRPFMFGVMVRGKDEVQLMHVSRWPGHHDWLRAQALGLAHLIEADLPSWPLTGEAGYLCSNTWCPAWSTCKGAHLG